jgi:hypothetical protein
MKDHNLRPGWLTLGCDLSYSNFTPNAYLQQLAMHGRLLQSTPSELTALFGHKSPAFLGIIFI